MSVNTSQTEHNQMPVEQTGKATTVPHVVVIGGGFGGLEAAKALGKMPVEVTLIDHNNFHLFQPMLYQIATAGLSPSDIATPLREIVREQENTAVLMAEVTGVDLKEQQVLMDDQALHYDYLIIATGACSNYFGHEKEWQKLAPSMKTIDDGLDVRRVVLSAFEAAEREPNPEKQKALLTFVLVGGGPTGVELAGAVAELSRETLKGNFRHIHPNGARIVLVQGPKHILPGFPVSLADKVQKKLNQMGIEVRTGLHVKDIKPDGVMIGDEHLAAENVIWTAGVKASPAGEWLHADVDHRGRVKVQSDLTVPNHTNIFVIGDTAAAQQNGKPLPGLAPVAMQEGRYVASVIANRIAGTAEQPAFHYVDKGTLATVGRSYGVVNIGPLRFTGLFAWWMWLFIHILFLIGVQNRIVVFFQYAWSYFTFQRSARVILPGAMVRSPQ